MSIKEIPSAYEESQIKAIHTWKNHDQNWYNKAMEVVNWPINKASNLVMEAPGVGDVIEKSASGLVDILNDFSQWTVRSETILNEFRECGNDVNDYQDISKLDLEKVDKVIGFLGAKYKSMALIEGATTGAIGLPGIPADIVAIVLLNLRAIGEYATYCGFDVNSQQERLFAMNVLGLASSPTDASKMVAMAQLVRIARDVARRTVWAKLENHLFVQVMQQIAKALGVRLTKAKLAQAVPATGAVIGGGFNAYFTAKVCEAAYYLYRERLMATKYGADIIKDVAVDQTDFNKVYAEEAPHFQ